MFSENDAPAPDAVEVGKSVRASAAPALLLFTATLFLSALLLFSVQPLFARMVLPRLGGTPAVWSVAMVFFQAMLLAGYAYAHLLVRQAGAGRALLVHAAIMTLALLWLPIGVAAGFETPPSAGLPAWLLALFAASVGVPFFAVAANAPLLQAWFSRTGHPHAADPYFLYGSSNLGSFFALLAYPILIEPLMTLGGQSRLWTGLYGALALAVLGCGFVAMSARRAGATADDVADPARPVTWRKRARWMALASLPSALLIAVTAHLSTNIAAVPLLWVLPLAVFLLTFVVAFQRSPLVPRRAVELMVPFSAVGAILTYGFSTPLGGLLGIAINLFAFFAIALAWHSALVACRPPARHLTDFYLSMSAGGVLGGAFASLAAPVLFESVVEFPLLLALSLLVVPEARDLLRGRRGLALGGLVAGALVLVTAIDKVEYRDRSFFGVVSTRVVGDGAYRVLVHGTTVHGAERIVGQTVGEGAARPEPLTYYAEGGPLASGIALEQARRDQPLTVGVVGLGVGSLACYRRPDEAWRFYEIDPAVITAATNPALFTFVSICARDAAIVPGDARLSLTQEPDGALDILVIDAFSSDSIPVHLLTQEALKLYAEKAGSDGVVLMHISNQFMELGSVIGAGAAAEGLTAARMLHIRPEAETAEQKLSSDVVVLARNPARLEAYLARGWKPLRKREDVAAWTDDYANVMAAILRREGLL
ncbi:MAG TPA: fused MFS/spermidine synthase [Propylenella sp.]